MQLVISRSFRGAQNWSFGNSRRSSKWTYARIMEVFHLREYDVCCGDGKYLTDSLRKKVSTLITLL